MSQQPYPMIGIIFATEAACAAKELELSVRVSDGIAGHFALIQKKYATTPDVWFLDLSGCWDDLTEQEKAQVIEIDLTWFPPPSPFAQTPETE